MLFLRRILLLAELATMLLTFSMPTVSPARMALKDALIFVATRALGTTTSSFSLTTSAFRNADVLGMVPLILLFLWFKVRSKFPGSQVNPRACAICDQGDQGAPPTAQYSNALRRLLVGVCHPQDRCLVEVFA